MTDQVRAGARQDADGMRTGGAMVRWHSVSSTREYEGCPRRYRFGYVDRLPKDRPVPPSWRFGTVVHAALEAAWRAAMAGPADAPVRAHLGAALDALEQALAQEDLVDERERAVDVVTRALEVDVVRDGALDHDADLPLARPVGVEEALRGRIDQEHRIIGFVDLILERPDGVIELVDHKVTARRSTPDELHDDFQLNLYGRLARARFRGATGIVATHHYPTGPESVSVRLDEDEMARAEQRVRDAARAIADDTDFVPITSERCRHCPWQPSCPEGTVWVEEHGG
jgi:RecB family exonuclease